VKRSRSFSERRPAYREIWTRERQSSQLIKERDHLAGENDKKQQLIKSLHQELAGDEAELDDDDDDPLLQLLRRECERHVKDCEERLKKSQTDGEMQSILIDKIKHDLRGAREEADDAQRGAITMFNEQKRYELNIQRLQSDDHQARTSMEKMRTEAVNLRMKIQELRDEGKDRQRLCDGAVAENQAALEERDSTIADLRSLFDRRRRESNELEQSIANNHDDRTRLQLHSTEMSTFLVAV
jgi:hypothetical protein